MIPQPAIEEFVPELEAATPERDQDRRIAAGVRGYFAAVREYLRALHRGGESGGRVNEANSDAIDRAIRRLARLAETAFYAGGGDVGDQVCIAAAGGYARREMSVCSDIDLLFLHGGELNPLVANLAERIQRWLWDAGVTVGAAVRNIPDTLALAREDRTVGTALLDTRFLGGDAGLLHDLAEAIRRDLLADAAAFIAAQRGAMEERHRKYGESLYLLQPNLKEGAGGLRDYHAAYWAARAALPTLRGSDDLLHVGLLTETEMREYREALEFLWKVRNEMHLLLGREVDQLSFEHQEHVARTFGYVEAGAELPVERFMGAYYRHARAVQTHSEFVIEQCLARTLPAKPRPKARPVEDGFVLAGDQLEIPHAAHLRERPLRLLSCFAVAQRHQVPLSRGARRLVRENLDLIDDDFRSSSEASAVLLSLLESDEWVVRSLMAMNEVGVLGRYLPEWDHVVCRWQHVVYHTYTVDVHSLFLVEALRRLRRGEHERALPELTELVQSAPDRAVLFLGCLLHDIGKGYGGNHSKRGEVLARQCLTRLGLERNRVDRVCFLVEHHLLMSHVAQRRDLSDSKVIVEFARIARDRENLRNLYLVTYADIRACSASAWNQWKGRLVQELYERAAEFLESGGDDPERALEQMAALVQTRREAAFAELRALGVAAAKIHQYFDMMPRRYFLTHAPRQIARHARVVLAFAGERPLATSVREMPDGVSEFLLCARDVHGLYANVAGCLTAVGINILGSHVYTTRTGLALEVYRVTTPEGGEEEKRLAWAQLEQSLEEVLRGRKRVDQLLRRRKAGRTASPSRRPPTVQISNSESDFYTVIDVAANDRLGLLYDLTRTLADHGLATFISKAATILDQVADTFYVRDATGKKLSDPKALAELERDLLEVAGRESADA